jgi:hypothetical protein
VRPQPDHDENQTVLLFLVFVESHPRSVVRVHPGQVCIPVAEFLMWERLRKLDVELFESGARPLRAALATSSMGLVLLYPELAYAGVR